MKKELPSRNIQAMFRTDLHAVWLLLQLVLMGTSVTASSYECPDPWIDHMDKCYKFNIYPNSLQRAEELCSNDGAKLVSVNGADEHTFVLDWLSRENDLLRMWYTSGRKTDEDSVQYFWEGDATNITGAIYWLNTENLGVGDRIVYAFEENQWGWKLIEPTVDLPFICEIHKDYIYQIFEEGRDFTYGLSSANLEALQRGPFFVKQPQDFIYDVDSVDQYLELECIAEGNPQVNYAWLMERDQQVIEVDPMIQPRYTVINGKLIIHYPDQNEDNGDYQCRASNIFGAVLSNKVQISFGYLLDFPRSARDPVTVEAYAGVGIECNPPKHYPAILYSWSKDFTLNFVMSITKPYVFISRNGKLYFSQVTNDDEGDYYCHVSSPRAGVTSTGGKVSTAIELIVTESIGSVREPQIASGFPAVFPSSPKQGDNVAIECFAWGTTELVYSWQRIDGIMPEQVYFTEHHRILHIPSVQLLDAGTYHCTCMRINGQSDSANVQLHVDAEPFFTIPLSDQHIDIHGAMQLHCIASGIPAVTYSWYLNGTQLLVDNILPEDQPRFSIQYNSVTITDMTVKDQGMYQCAATNLYGTRYSQAQVRVLAFAPTFDKNPVQQNTYGTQRGNATIICNPEAAPRATKEWKKNGLSLSFSNNQNGNMILLPNGNLLFNSINTGNKGVYTCTATNEYGTASSSGNLTILTTTTITNSPAPNTVIVNGTTFLPCQASYNPLLDVTYMWYHNDRPVEFIRVRYIGNIVSMERDEHYTRGTGIKSGGLYIKRAQFYHEGKYRCMVETSSEIIERSMDLYVHGPPAQPAAVSGTDTTDHSIHLMWKTTRNNGGQIMSYIMEATIVPRPDLPDEDIKFCRTHTVEGQEIWKEVKTNIRVFITSTDQQPETTVDSLNAWSTYRFRVRAVNMYGIGNPSDPSPEYTTHQAVPTKFPNNVGGGGGKVGTLVITWEPLDCWDYNGEGLRYLVKWKNSYLGEDEWDQAVVDEPTAGEYVALVGELNFYMEYDVQVTAVNDEGTGPPSPVITIWSAEDIPIGTPTEVQASLYNGTALLVSWVPVDDTREKIKGVLLGYRINYWKDEGGSEQTAIYRPLAGQRDHGLIIGLEHHTYYRVTVQVFNTAGNGPKSQHALEETLRSPPRNAPTEVHVDAVSDSTINVRWRGVQTNYEEEPLQGYLVRYWRNGESYYQANDIDANRDNHIQVTGLERDVLYNLRVLGYSLGGEGLASSPIIQFILGVNCQVLEASPERRFVYTCGAGGLQLSFLLAILLVLNLLTR